MASFLAFPRKLRNNVYRYITKLSVQVPPETYAGLYVSCKQVKQELDEETRRPLLVFAHNVRRPYVVVLTSCSFGRRDIIVHMSPATEHSCIVLEPNTQCQTTRINLHSIILRYDSWAAAPTNSNQESSSTCASLLAELAKLPISTRHIVFEVPVEDDSHLALRPCCNDNPIHVTEVGGFWEFEIIFSKDNGTPKYLKATVSKLHHFKEPN